MEGEQTIGLVKRLYQTDSTCRFYVTFKYPERYFGIAFSFSNNISINTLPFQNLKELEVILLKDTSYRDYNMLVIQLFNLENRDVFAALCENLIQSIDKQDSESKISRTVINQLEKWKILFSRDNTAFLTTSEQQGLYGELHFLQKILAIPNANLFAILHCWVGVDKALRDFQGSNWAVEVKTSSSNNPQIVTINGERQLDETLLEDLFLFHLSVEVSNANGETLCDKIGSIRRLLRNDIPASYAFNAKLFEAGYLDKHEAAYKGRAYQIRNENYYRVNAEFPRIRETDLRKGVCNVKYSISLAMCNDYIVEDTSVFDIIKSL
jgi:hypothetical protein